MYGIDNSNQIVEYNLEQKVVRKIFDTNFAGTGCCNSFAFDGKLSQMYFIHQASTGSNARLNDGLYYWDQGGSSVNKIAALAEIGLDGTATSGSELSNPANAAFAND